MSDYWRIRAKHSTVCPLCRGYLKPGDWIVMEDRCEQWAHAVCPVSVRKKPVRTDEERKISRTVIKFSDEGRVA